MTPTQHVIDALSRDSSVTDDVIVVGQSLAGLYTGHLSLLLAAIEDLARDPKWSQDRAPYQWLAEVRAAVADPTI